MTTCIRVPILNTDYSVVVVFGGRKKLIKVLKYYGYEDAEESAEHSKNKRGVCFYSAGLTPVISMPKSPTTNEEFGTLAHEAVHAVDFLMKFIGQNDVGEVFAHSVGAIVRETLQENDRRKKRKKHK